MKEVQIYYSIKDRYHKKAFIYRSVNCIYHKPGKVICKK